MARLPVISGRDAAKRFGRLGYRVDRQRGSHMRLLHPTDPSRKPLTIPDHAELGRGLLRKLLRDAHLTVQEFIDLQ